MKTNAIFKRAFNACLRVVETRSIGDDLGSEVHLSDILGVSRTTVRAILERLAAASIIGLAGRRKTILRHPVDADYFPNRWPDPGITDVARRFMEWMLSNAGSGGKRINSHDLAREFDVPPTALRDYLQKLTQIGLLRRQPNNDWIFLGFNSAVAEELCDVRDLFELRSTRNFCTLPAEHPAWRKLAEIERQHRAVLAEPARPTTDFSELDERFHRLVYSTSGNRFMDQFHVTMSIVFYLHHLWNASETPEANSVAIREHLAYIEALRRRDLRASIEAARIHLASARSALLEAIRRQGCPPAPVPPSCHGPLFDHHAAPGSDPSRGMTMG